MIGAPTPPSSSRSPRRLLFVFMFGIIEVGYALWMQNALDYSTAAAARCASLSTSQSSGNSPCAPVGGNSQVTTYAAGESGASLDNTAFVYTSNAACGCQVTGNYTIALDIPLENALSVNLSSSACIAPPPNIALLNPTGSEAAELSRNLTLWH